MTTPRTIPPAPSRSLADPEGLVLADSSSEPLIERAIQRTLFPLLAESESERSVGFLARAFILATLPHSRPDSNEFTRSNGYFRLNLLAPASTGLPYGRYPRLVLAWLTTRAVKEKTPYLELGPTFARFAQSMGITPTTGPRGTLSGLREQIIKLLSVTVSSVWDNKHDPDVAPDLKAHAGTGYRVAFKHKLWWDRDDSPLDLAWVQLGADFFHEITERPVPIDLAIIQKLRAPLEIDVYNWLTYRSIRSGRIARAETIPWKDLYKQFGSDYAALRVFKYKFLKHLKVVLQHYPEPRLEEVKDGLKLHPYRPSVPRLYSGTNLTPKKR